MGERRVAVVPGDDRVTVVSPDLPGTFSRVAGVLTLHGLSVLGAEAHSDAQGMAASEFTVQLPEGRRPSWEPVVADLHRALAGQLALEARLAEKAKVYRRRRAQSAATPGTRLLFDDRPTDSTVIEVHAPDRVGVLYRITKALADVGLDIRHARVQTLGDGVVDAFYVRTQDGGPLRDEFHRAEVERAVLHAVHSPG
jgi:[protein-PII] uridylyltransferase